MFREDSRPVLGRVDDSCASKHYEDYDNINIERSKQTATGSWIPEDLDYDEESVARGRNNQFSNRAAVSDWSMEVTFHGKGKGDQGHYRGPIHAAGMTQQQVPDEECTWQNLTDHQLLLLHPKTRAFALKTKTWCEFCLI